MGSRRLTRRTSRDPFRKGRGCMMIDSELEQRHRHRTELRSGYENVR